ncbi:MAG: ComF family protein [Elusimicrobia bacterium]|jgi:ComF family protein|nr:ComF family protein [Elusimicrobiota bacterium]
MEGLRRLAAWAAHWLFPQTCAHCREDLPREEDAPLCARCRQGLRLCAPPFCLRCAEPVCGGRAYCTACLGRSFACPLVRAAFLYRGPAPALVRAFKYRGRREAARAAGRWMACLLPGFPELSGHDALVPVPLHPRRLRERGYNQARLLAEELGRLSGLPVLDLLERARPTRPQWDLGRQSRRANLAGAFQASPRARGSSVLLIDDVCTSGASLEECARALLRAGASRVAAYVLARQTLRPVNS